MAVPMTMMRVDMVMVVRMVVPGPAVCMWGCAHRGSGYANSAILGQRPLD